MSLEGRHALCQAHFQARGTAPNKRKQIPAWLELMLTGAGRSSTQAEGVGSFLHGVKDSLIKGKELVNPSGENQPASAVTVTPPMGLSDRNSG